MHRLALLLCVGITTSAWADPATDPPPPTAPPPTLAPAGVTPMTPMPDGGALDGLRLRHGIAATFGEEVGSGPSSGLSGVLYGLDWRFGVQLNNLYAVYLQTHLSFGTAHIGSTSGVTGNFAETAIVERTFVNRYFVGVGGGYGILNNPSGPVLQVRAGWYPFMGASELRPRRRGLMIGADIRAYFAGDSVGTVTQAMVSLGYEKY